MSLESEEPSPPPALPAAVTVAYDLLLWGVNHVGKFPRSHRFVLGERIETAMLAVVLDLIQVAYSREKTGVLRQANLELEKLRILVRLAKDLGFTSVKQYEYAARELDRVGRQVGGWLRHEGRRG